MKRIICFIVLLFSLSVLTTGCRNVPKHVVSISPTEKTIVAGESATLTVTAADHTSITWPEKTGDTANYTMMGDTVVWTPPAIAGKYEFTVNATADSARTAKATITVIERKIIKIATSGETGFER